MAARPAPAELESLRLVTKLNPTSVAIPPTPGMTTEIVEVWIDGPADRSYVDVVVGTTTQARLPNKRKDRKFFAPFKGSIDNISFFGMLRRLFGEDVKVQADQSETITFNFSAAPAAVHILYKLTTETVDKSRPLRSREARVPLFAIATHSAALNATKNFSLDTAVMPTGFPTLADGVTIPSGSRFTLKALAFGSAAAGSTAATALHIWRKTLELFTPIDHAGISVHPTRNLLVFDIATRDVFTVPDYAYEAGDKLTLNIDVSYDGTNAIAAGTLAAFLIGWFEGVR
jgi:hypothetical protein